MTQIFVPGHWLSRWQPATQLPCAEQILPEPFVPGLHCPSLVQAVVPVVVVPPEDDDVVDALHMPDVQVWPVGQSQLV